MSLAFGAARAIVGSSTGGVTPVASKGRAAVRAAFAVAEVLDDVGVDV